MEQKQDFDLIITDLAMPGAAWLPALTKIHTLVPDTPITVISAVFDKEILQQTLDIGVAGYIPKTASNNLIVSAINLVLAGGIYIPHELLYSTKLEPAHNESKQKEYYSPLKTLEKFAENTLDAPQKGLTERQIDIVKCIAEGLSNKQIAYKPVSYTHLITVSKTSLPNKQFKTKHIPLFTTKTNSSPAVLHLKTKILKQSLFLQNKQNFNRKNMTGTHNKKGCKCSL